VLDRPIYGVEDREGPVVAVFAPVIDDYKYEVD